MTYRIYISLLSACIIGAAVCTLAGVSAVATSGLCAAALLFTVLLWRAVHKPMNAIENGIYLLLEQDFSSRLRETGEPSADKVVKLFNGLMDAMKEERLKLKEQEHLLSLLIEASPAGIAICDFNDRIVLRNKAFRALMPTNSEKELEALADDESVIIRSGSMVCRCSKLWFMDSGFRKRFYMIEPMTEEIIRAEKKMFSTVIRTIGHEVNNTMGCVRSVLETLHGLHADDSQIVPVVSSSIDSCTALTEFVSGYSSLVKLPEPEPVPVRLAVMIERMLPSLKTVYHNIELKAEAREAIMQIDEMLMQRVITNIVKNSAESIGANDSGKIIIQTGAGSIDIIDNGAGISPGDARKLFTPFFSTKRPDRGLGLMLVADILHSHGANFSLSTDDSTGLTTFHIQFTA